MGQAYPERADFLFLPKVESLVRFEHLSHSQRLLEYLCEHWLWCRPVNESLLNERAVRNQRVVALWAVYRRKSNAN